MDSIIDAVESLRKAMIGADKAALHALTMNELSYGHTSGLVEDRESFVEAISGDDVRDVFKQIELSEQTVSQAGDVAVIRHRFKAAVEVNGVLMSPDIKVLQIWCHCGGRWKLLARQAYKV